MAFLEVCYRNERQKKCCFDESLRTSYSSRVQGLYETKNNYDACDEAVCQAEAMD